MAKITVVSDFPLKLCNDPKCDKQACFGAPGTTMPCHCYIHHLKTEVDLRPPTKVYELADTPNIFRRLHACRLEEKKVFPSIGAKQACSVQDGYDY